MMTRRVPPQGGTRCVTSAVHSVDGELDDPRSPPTEAMIAAYRAA
jgi:hypothetical protein